MVINKFGEDNILDFQLQQIKNLDNYFKGKLILSFISAIPVDHINFLSSIKKLRNSVYIKVIELNEHDHFPNDGHPNKKGHFHIAQQFYEFIEINKIIPCN